MRQQLRNVMSGVFLVSLVSCAAGTAPAFAKSDEIVVKGQVTGVILKKECVVTSVGESAFVNGRLAYLQITYRCRLEISTKGIAVNVETNRYNIGQAVKLVPNGANKWLISPLHVS